MVAATLRNAGVPVPLRKVVATHGKRLRAEPVVLLYERGLVHHVGVHPALEAQMSMWVPGDRSPDRLDALVMALTDLARIGGTMTITAPAGRVPSVV
jgi:phage terminase large subunit-like protein